MAVVVIADAPGMTAEQDQAVQERLNRAGGPPSGRIARLAGPIEGGWRILTIWESEADWHTFVRERLAPAAQQEGRPVVPPQIWSVQHIELAPQAR
jgi:hypothetical protein